jgi:6-phosphofructokinase 1
MGHNVGWLALGAGIAGGSDVILIPEIPYDIEKVAEAIRRRQHGGKNFSIVAVSEGAMSRDEAAAYQAALVKKEKARAKNDDKARQEIGAELALLEAQRLGSTQRLSHQLEALTGLETRLTILGHVQRGGTPSAVDRLLATRLGTACATLINDGTYNVMVAVRGEGTEPVPLEKVVGQRKTVPLDHPWLETARRVGTSLGD